VKKRRKRRRLRLLRKVQRVRDVREDQSNKSLNFDDLNPYDLNYTSIIFKFRLANVNRKDR